ncbi:MAG: hypothetical protein J1F66_01500 [Clostridiales bacterium]|nr:hypothetical protein [Clostridiales bacterium]
MYSKRVLILQQSSKRFAERGKELCGLIKLINNSKDTTDVTVFVTNADLVNFGEWWVALSFNRVCFARQLSTLNNCTFALPQQDLDIVSALLIKREDKCYEAARAYLGDNACDSLNRQMEFLLRDAGSVESDKATPYEKFVASTADYYDGLDVNKLKINADSRYKSVSEYSDAFERYYATGGGAEYYESVKAEIGKVFTQFPPYYPLIRKYKGSFFVRIDFPSSDKYFVLGVLEKKGQIKYICYGLPAEKEGFSDKDFVYVEDSPVSFWMLFQDATTGQISALNELL